MRHGRAARTTEIIMNLTMCPHRVADLHVYEGQAHASYLRDVPERDEAFEETARFFDTHLDR